MKPKDNSLVLHLLMSHTRLLALENPDNSRGNASNIPQRSRGGGELLYIHELGDEYQENLYAVPLPRVL
jgi:hypothetical protein